MMDARLIRRVNLVYTKPLDSVFRALWLATQTRDSICYSPSGIFLDFAREFSLISQKERRNDLVLA